MNHITRYSQTRLLDCRPALKSQRDGPSKAQGKAMRLALTQPWVIPANKPNGAL